jgi:V/A-type H+-transporting ATPase subunit E
VVNDASNLIKDIEEQAEEKAEGIIAGAKSYRDTILEEAKNKAESEKEKILKTEKQKVEEELARYRASLRLKSRQRLVEAKHRILTDTLDMAKQRLQGLTESKKYTEVLTRLVNDAIEVLEEEEVELIFPEGHSKLLDKSKAKKEAADILGKTVKINISKRNVKAIGGVIVKSMDATKWIDNTFESRLQRMQVKIHTKLAGLLFN